MFNIHLLCLFLTVRFQISVKKGIKDQDFVGKFFQKKGTKTKSKKICQKKAPRQKKHKKCTAGVHYLILLLQGLPLRAPTIENENIKMDLGLVSLTK